LRRANYQPSLHLLLPRQLLASLPTRKFSGGSIVTTSTSKEVFEQQYERVFGILDERLSESDDLDIAELEVELTSDGVLKVSLEDVGTWVLNKHSVTRQMWLSSPISGPNKYNFHETGSEDPETQSLVQSGKRWLGERNRHSLHDRLEQEFRESFPSISEFKFRELF